MPKSSRGFENFLKCVEPNFDVPQSTTNLTDRLGIISMALSEFLSTPKLSEEKVAKLQYYKIVFFL